MAYKIIYTAIAEADIDEAMDYFINRVSLKVGESFYEDWKEAEIKLKYTPYFQKIYKDFHRLPFHKFPYIFIYKIEKQSETIRVFRIFHASQNPEKYP